MHLVVLLLSKHVMLTSYRCTLYSSLLSRWVPQLQLHMHSSGCLSALIVSRSATKGTRLYRMYRDDEYIARMLQTVSKVYRSFVLPPMPDTPPLGRSSHCCEATRGAATGTMGAPNGMANSPVRLRHVKEPPANMFFKNNTAYRDFLIHTVRLARSAKLISEWNADE